MLRWILFGVAVLVTLGGAVALWLGHPEGQLWAQWGSVVFIILLVEQWRYRNRTSGNAADWQATAERFVDPTSGEPMQVFFNPRTGERRYEPVTAERDAGA